jgi:O-antigen/teichoic acid export membrane protein
MNNDLARRSVSSVGWNMVGGMSGMVVLFVRSVLLARLLPVDVFGVYAGAGALVALTAVFTTFGMGGAFLHRSAETQDEQRAAAVHWTLKLLFTLAWAAVMIAFALLYTVGSQRLALIVLTLTQVGDELTQTSRLILIRRVVHRRLALLQLLDTIFTSVAAVGLALLGAGLWALLATDIVSMLLGIIGLLILRPVWRPRLAWRSSVVRYYLRFGSRNLTAGLLLTALDRLDDLWTLRYLGETALGYYSRAYTFATYPRKILAAPVNQVVSGAYAELKGDRRRLSQAFFRGNALLVRSGFFLAGLLALIAPEFIMILLGEKWLPMLQAFRLMLIFTLLDPIKMTVSDLFIAVGRPDKVVRVRLVQLAILVVGLFALGPRWGIAGVALAVNAMLVVGLGVLLWQARQYVDFSIRGMFAVPGGVLASALVITAAALSLVQPMLVSPWWSATVKIVLFSTCYLVLLVLLERTLLHSPCAPHGSSRRWMHPKTQTARPTRRSRHATQHQSQQGVSGFQRLQYASHRGFLPGIGDAWVGQPHRSAHGSRSDFPDPLPAQRGGRTGRGSTGPSGHRSLSGGGSTRDRRARTDH